MIILLDESIPQKLRDDFGDQHEVYTVQYKGWAGKKNGELLELMLRDGFELFITVDQNLSYQQNLSKYNLTVAVLCGQDNKLETLRLLIPKLLKRINENNTERIIIIS
jgi:hypothetical protein